MSPLNLKRACQNFQQHSALSIFSLYRNCHAGHIRFWTATNISTFSPVAPILVAVTVTSSREWMASTAAVTVATSPS